MAKSSRKPNAAAFSIFVNQFCIIVRDTTGTSTAFAHVKFDCLLLVSLSFLPLHLYFVITQIRVFGFLTRI